MYKSLILFHWATATVQAKERSSLPNPPKATLKPGHDNLSPHRKVSSSSGSTAHQAWYKSQILTTECIQTAFQWWSPVCPAMLPALEDSSSAVQRSWSTLLPGPQPSHLLWVQKERFLTDPHCPELFHIRLTQPHHPWKYALEQMSWLALQRNLWKASPFELCQNAVKTASHNP